MRSRGLLMLLIALVAGLAAVVMAARWMQSQGERKSGIIVASVDIERGAKLTSEVLRTVAWPEDHIPPGAFTDVTKLTERVAAAGIIKGEPVLEARLAPVGAKGGLSAVVSPGKRAMAVRVNEVIGVAGFALPGTFVDVMVNIQGNNSGGDERERTISKIVLERVPVLAVGSEAEADSNKPKVVNAVTLEVTPQDAEKLDLARSVGTLSLVLRNQLERDGASTAGVTKSELLGVDFDKPNAKKPAPPSPATAAVPVRVSTATPPPAPRPRSTDCVELIRGASKVTECF